jgi:riboflavin kinase/FMN adenylyltransferase
MTGEKMNIYEYTPGRILPGGAVIALGLFDGVHNGHRLLLNSARELAKRHGLTFSVFTFRSEAMNKGGGALYSTEDKLRLLRGLGVESVILADFNTLAGICAETFVKRLLITEMGCEIAVCGFDFRFGHGALGDAELLEKLMKEYGKDCSVEAEHKIDGEKISTTRIKALLGEGDVRRARKFLGMPYFITSSVGHGRGEGRSLGFPTANLEAAGLTHLRRGVYSCIVKDGGSLYRGVANVGTCPTFEQREQHTETYIIDYSGDLYGKKIRIFFLDFMREEKAFSSEKELIMQINVDKNKVLNKT